MTARGHASLQGVLACIVGLSVLHVVHGTGYSQRPAAPRPTAMRVVDLQSGAMLVSEGEALLLRDVQPGSTIKLATLIAALESGVISGDTRIHCPGSIVIGRERLACVHPRLRRPLRPADALAYSCNVFFATVGRKLARDRLNSTLASLGLPPVPAAAPMPLAATGAQATSVPPATLLQGWRRMLPGSAVALRQDTRDVLAEGLRGAAMFGTASAFAARGIAALAKTGTALTPGGGAQGLAVAAWPATAPRVAAIAVVLGGTGTDAATVIAARAADVNRLLEGAQPPPSGNRNSSADGLSVPAATTRDRAASGRASAASQQERAISVAPPTESRTIQTPDSPRTAEPKRPQASPAPQGPSPKVPRAAGTSEPVIRVGVISGSGTASIRQMPLEEYVARVLAGEAVPRSAPAALEALAITARTFALANRNRHARDGFDLCTLTHCQVLREPNAGVTAAAAATRGQILAWRGAPASVYYTASCGGRTERPSAVWPGAADPPFLPVQKDDGCGGEPRWVSEIEARDLTRALRQAGFRGEMVRNVRVRARADSGRAAVLEIRGMAPDTISGQALRMAVGRALGWQLLKSTEFDVRRSGRGYRFSGRGFGHGVGFCVIGSARRAERGASRAALLAQYFPGTTVTTVSAVASIAPGGTAPAPAAADLASGDAPAVSARTEPATPAASGILLTLPDGNADDRSMLQSLAERLLRSAAAATGQPVPARIQLVFHPSTESFRRETSQPWWSAAATAGTRIDLQPVDVLRGRGVLESTLAHEIGHVVTARATADRPAWVQEGAAMYAGGLTDGAGQPGPKSGRRRVSCPSDDELRRPVSAGAARDAYARARECFARAVEQGTHWDEVR